MERLRTQKHQREGLKSLIEFTGLKKAKMLEVGSYLGESARIFAESGRFSEINCLDLWAGGYDDFDWASQNMLGVEDHFLNFAKQFPKLINIHKKNSNEIPSLFKDRYFDFIYIDANHTKQAVTSDILSCIPKIKKGGFIAGHDYGDMRFLGVAEAVNDVFSFPDKTFQDFSWIKKII